MFETDAVLLDQTMLCEASRLLAGSPVGHEYTESLQRFDLSYGVRELQWRAMPLSNAERLLHLETTARALLLYERLYVVSAELPPDATALPLRQILLNFGIVEELDTTEVAQEIAFEIHSLAEAAAGVSRYGLDPEELGEAGPIDVPRLVHDTAFTFLKPEPPNYHEAGIRFLQAGSSHYAGQSKAASFFDLLRSELEDVRQIPRPWHRIPQGVRQNPIVILGGELYDALLYYHSGDPIKGVSILRTFLYWRLSSYLNLPFYPSLHRMGHYSNMTGFVQTSIQDSVYRIVADAFDSTLSELYEEERDVPLRLPPAGAVLLARIRETGDLEEAIDGLRLEYEPLRREMAQLQARVRFGTTLGVRLAAKRRIREVLNDLAKHHADESDALFSDVIDFAQEVINPISRPFDPTSYSAALVKKPSSWVRRWWLRRPFRIAYNVRKMLLALEPAAGLAEEVLGVRIHPDDFNGLRQLVSQDQLGIRT